LHNLHFISKNQKGQAIIFFAVLLPVALAFLGFTLDIGRLQLIRTQLQAAVDAASLAGASTAKVIVIGDEWANIYEKKVVLDEDEAEDAAYNCLMENMQHIPQAALLWHDIDPDSDTSTVKVRAKVRIPTYFMNLVGKTYLETSRYSKSTAKAE